MTLITSTHPAFSLVAAAKLSNEMLFTIGLMGGVVLIMMSYANWRLAVKSALVIALFEGAIRKWVFPAGQELVYFLKDVFLIGAYLKFFLEPGLEPENSFIYCPIEANV